MIPMIIIKNITEIVLPRPFSPDKSVASEKYETVAKLKPIPQAPKATNPNRSPIKKFSASTKAARGERTTPKTQNTKPIAI